jgi:hypothetical protein
MRRLADAAALAGALLREAVNHVYLRDHRTAMERAEELLVIATEYGMRFHAAVAAFVRGWALADEGRGQEGLAEMSRALPARKIISQNFGGLVRGCVIWNKTGSRLK